MAKTSFGKTRSPRQIKIDGVALPLTEELMSYDPASRRINAECGESIATLAFSGKVSRREEAEAMARLWIGSIDLLFAVKEVLSAKIEGMRDEDEQAIGALRVVFNDIVAPKPEHVDVVTLLKKLRGQISPGHKRLHSEIDAAIAEEEERED